MKLLIKGGTVIDPAAGIKEKADVLIEGERIAGVEKKIRRPAEAEEIKADGCLVVPGLIDMHVHLREPGYEYKETIATGTAAAAAGGFTAVACMPNTNPVCDQPAVVEYILRRADAAGFCRVYPIGAITKGQEGRELAEIGQMKEAGAVAVSDDGRPVADARIMRLAMEYSRAFDLPVISHCEDPHLAAEGVMHEGYWSTVLGLRGMPAAAEEVMVARDLILAEVTGARLHIAHVSTARSVELVRAAKARGVQVTAEVTPHHLYLTDAAVQGYDPDTKVNPPLRSEADVRALREALADGTIDVIATDHAPHAPEEKKREYNYAPFGMVGLETALPLMAGLVREGVLTWEQLVEKMSVNPARILKVPGGTLVPGTIADITIIDPEAEKIVDPEKFYSRGRNTPFRGWKLKGWPKVTIKGGRIIMIEGRIV